MMLNDFRSITFILFLIFFSNFDARTTFLKSKNKPFRAQNRLNLSKTISAKCFINQNSKTIYDLTSFYNPIVDYSSQVLDGFFLIYNFCHSPQFSCKNSSGLFNYNSTKGCVSLSGNSRYVSYQTQFDQSLNKTVLNARYPEGETCKTNVNKKYQMNIKYVCDPNTTLDINATGFNIDSCENTLIIRSSVACPKYNVYGLYNSLNDYKYIIGVIVFTLGLYIAFLGKSFYRFTEILAGIILVLFIVYYLIFNNIHIHIRFWQLIVITTVSVICGILLGYFIHKFQRIAPMILCGMAGFCFGNLIYHLFLKQLGSAPVLVFWLTILGSAGIGSMIGFYFNLIIMIGAITTLGSYLTIRGIAFMVGHFPDERQIYELLQNAEFRQTEELFTWVFYLYFGCFMILTVFSFYIQYKYFSTDYERNTNLFEEHEIEKKLNEDNVYYAKEIRAENKIDLIEEDRTVILDQTIVSSKDLIKLEESRK